MSKLTILVKRAITGVHEMFAHLCLVFLFQCVYLALISVEVVIVGLVGKTSKNFAWWVIEVSWSAVGIETLSLISTLLRFST